MNICKVLLSLLFLSLFFGCAKEEEESDASIKFKKYNFDISGAVAFGLSNPGRKLISIDNNGLTSIVNSDAEIYEMFQISSGVLISLNYGESWYVLNSDGSQVELSSSIEYRDFKGENSIGQLFFSDGSYYDPVSSEIMQINTSFDEINVEQVSGNFAIITSWDSEITQIHETVSGKRYNISDCYGSQMVALSSTIAYLDCGDDDLIDMSNGQGSSVENNVINNGDSEFFLVSDGAIFLSQNCPPNDYSSGYYVCHVSEDGTVTSLVTDSSTLGSNYNSDTENDFFYVSGDKFVVRELNQVWYGVRGVDQKNVILSGFNITDVHFSGTKVYYWGEDFSGNPFSGAYDIDSSDSSDIEYEGLSLSEIIPIL